MTDTKKDNTPPVDALRKAARQSAPEIVFRHPNGFVTDFGHELQMTDASTGEPAGTIPRYGVWKLSSRRKYEVVLTTNDLDEAKQKLDKEEK